MQQRFDALGDDHELGITDVSGGLISSEPDDALQAVVSSAAIATEAPIALVTLMLRRIQLFRAHVGLPPDLAAAGATDRCASFCQLVVRDRTPLLVEDAASDARVPQQLVDAYRIRAYYGVPLRVDERVIGSLCVIDVRPRPFSPEQRAAVERLADVAAERLAELVRSPDGASAAATQGLGLLRGGLATAVADTVVARIAAVELRPRLRAMESGATPALAVLSDASRAADDLEGALGRIDASLRRASSVLGAVERSVARSDAQLAVEIRDAVTTASALVQCAVRWRGAPPRQLVDAPAAGVINELALALSAAASAGAALPVELAAAPVGGSVELTIAGLGEAAATAAARSVIEEARVLRAKVDRGAVVLVLPARPRAEAAT